MTHSIGIRVYGIYKPVTEDDTIPHGAYCELHGELTKDVPDNIALQYLNEWKHQIELTEGLRANFIQTGSKNFIVQCQNIKTQTASVEVGTTPTGAKIYKTIVIAVSLSVKFIIGVILMAAVAAAAAWVILSGLQAVVHETGEVLSMFTPEQISGIINILLLVVALVFFSQIISLMPRIERKRE